MNVTSVISLFTLSCVPRSLISFFFCFNHTATTEIYTLSYTTLFRSSSWSALGSGMGGGAPYGTYVEALAVSGSDLDRKSTRLNSSHANISYAVFCLKKKKTFYTLARAQTRKCILVQLKRTTNTPTID